MNADRPKDKQSRLKRIAAERAVQLVEPGMVLGLGSGSTALLAIEFIAAKVTSGELHDIVGLPTSAAVERRARLLGIPLVSQDNPPPIDLTIDGADEVDPSLNLIKGGGGALLREKIVAKLSKREVIVIDDSKLSPQLGTRFPLPVEVVPFAWGVQAAFLVSLGATVTLRRRDDGAPFLTDQGNYILDCRFGPIADPAGLASVLDSATGIVEHGFFLGLATDVIVATDHGVEHLTRGDATRA